MVDHRLVSRGEAAAETGRGLEGHVVRHTHEVDLRMIDRHKLRERPPMGEPRLGLSVAYLLFAPTAGVALAARAGERHRDPGHCSAMPGPVTRSRRSRQRTRGRGRVGGGRPGRAPFQPVRVTRHRPVAFSWSEVPPRHKCPSDGQLPRPDDDEPPGLHCGLRVCGGQGRGHRAVLSSSYRKRRPSSRR